MPRNSGLCLTRYVLRNEGGFGMTWVFALIVIWVSRLDVLLYNSAKNFPDQPDPALELYFFNICLFLPVLELSRGLMLQPDVGRLSNMPVCEVYYRKFKFLSTGSSSYSQNSPKRSCGRSPTIWWMDQISALNDSVWRRFLLICNSLKPKRRNNDKNRLCGLWDRPSNHRVSRFERSSKEWPSRCSSHWNFITFVSSWYNLLIEDFLTLI